MPPPKGEDPLLGHPKYEALDFLGEGSFGFVLLARNLQTGEEVAIKFWPRGANTITKNVQREVLNHSSFLHPHIVQFKEVFVTEKYLCLVMEYVRGGDLLSYFNRHRRILKAEEVARWFFQQLIVALDYCHKKGVVNRDIKLENTLLDGSKKPLLKLTDFGFCKNLMDSSAKSQVGTPAYIAPEVILCKAVYDGKAADVWSCGVMLYIMLFMRYPFDPPPGSGKEERDDRGLTPALMRRIVNVDYTIPEKPVVSEDCKDLLRKLIVLDPEDRLTIPQIAQHPWFKEGLPADIFSVNDRCVPITPYNCQDLLNYPTIEEITAVLEEASVSKYAEINENSMFLSSGSSLQ